MAVDDLYQPGIVRGINPMDAVVATNASRDRRRRDQHQEQRKQKKVADYFHPLSKAVEATNRRLTERSLPYRFSVFKRWGDVYIELFILNPDGTVREKQRKNISHDDFNRIIGDVVAIEGLFFDHTA